MKNVFRTLVVVVFLAMAGTIACGGFLYVKNQDALKTANHKITKLSYENHVLTKKVENREKDLESFKSNNVYHDKDNYSVSCWDKDGKEYRIVKWDNGLFDKGTLVSEEK